MSYRYRLLLYSDTNDSTKIQMDSSRDATQAFVGLAFKLEVSSRPYEGLFPQTRLVVLIVFFCVLPYVLRRVDSVS